MFQLRAYGPEQYQGHDEEHIGKQGAESTIEGGNAHPLFFASVTPMNILQHLNIIMEEDKEDHRQQRWNEYCKGENKSYPP
jgi:hypothetical protein